MVDAARRGLGVALAPAAMFAADLRAGILVEPFATRIDGRSYWLTRLQSRADSLGMALFRTWLLDSAGAGI